MCEEFDSLSRLFPQPVQLGCCRNVVFTDAIVDPKLKGKAQKVMLICVQKNSVYLMVHSSFK